MRSEREMFDLILGTAKEDERIRGVYMNGSRTNRNAVRDIFQDYDIVYVVEDVKPFREDTSFIDRFGKRLYMQMPEKMDADRGDEIDLDACYGWLIQFADGNRMDLHVASREHAQKDILADTLCEILLDKDNALPKIGESSEKTHYVRKPSAVDFSACDNEFWWCLNNVAKGLWREEIPYVQDMLNLYVRPQLTKMLSWKIGAEHDFSVSVGKSGKYMYRYLPEQQWKAYLSTYGGSRTEELWDSVISMCRLFKEVSAQAAKLLGYSVDEKMGDASFRFLEDVRRLPKDAKEIY